MNRHFNNQFERPDVNTEQKTAASILFSSDPSPPRYQMLQWKLRATSFSSTESLCFVTVGLHFHLNPMINFRVLLNITYL